MRSINQGGNVERKGNRGPRSVSLLVASRGCRPVAEKRLCLISQSQFGRYPLHLSCTPATAHLSCALVVVMPPGFHALFPNGRACYAIAVATRFTSRQRRIPSSAFRWPITSRALRQLHQCR